MNLKLRPKKTVKEYPKAVTVFTYRFNSFLCLRVGILYVYVLSNTTGVGNNFASAQGYDVSNTLSISSPRTATVPLSQYRGDTVDDESSLNKNYNNSAFQLGNNSSTELASLTSPSSSNIVAPENAATCLTIDMLASQLGKILLGGLCLKPLNVVTLLLRNWLREVVVPLLLLLQLTRFLSLQLLQLTRFLSLHSRS